MKEKKIVYVEPVSYFPEEIRRKYGLGEYKIWDALPMVRAVMLGHAVGDALGVPVEFCSREKLDENPVRGMRGRGTYHVPKGTWSDDTSMSLATLDSLKSGEVDYEEIMQNFLAWLADDKYTSTGKSFDVGKTCLSSIRRYAKGGTSALECGEKGEYSNGNGSLMRIHPVALYAFVRGIPEERGIEIIHNVSSLTHAHERSKIACGIYAFILWELLKNPQKSSVVDGICRAELIYGGCKEYSAYKRLREQIVGISDKEATREPLCRSEISSTGYVVDTLEAAVWCLLTTDSYKECVLKAVNLGEDTDTVAAVAGGLAGALYGFSAIPTQWLRTLKEREYIDRLCEEATAEWWEK